jgi:hypothetical protein
MKVLRTLTLLAIFSILFNLGGCWSDASIASRNLSEGADNFQINRRIVFYNGITDKYMLVVEGRCSIEVDPVKKKLDVTCKVGDTTYKKHFLGISDNVTYFVEQIDSAGVDTYHYKLVFKPESIIPDIRLKVQ